MQYHYGAAELISALQAGRMKDMYWRNWKGNVYSAWNDLASEFTSSLSSIGLRCSVVVSGLRQGATFFIEPAQHRKWTPANAAPGYALLFPLPAPPCVPGHCWPPTQMTPAVACRFQQIVLGGVEPGLVFKQADEVDVSLGGNCVPVCTIVLYKLMTNISNWDSIVEVNTEEEISCKVVKRHPYVTRCKTSGIGKVFGDGFMDIKFMTDDVISTSVFEHIQRAIVGLALTRYRIALHMVTLLRPQNLELLNILIPDWCNATNQLFFDLAEKISHRLKGAALELCFEGTNNFRSFSIRKKWVLWSNDWSYVAEPVDMFAFAPPCNEMTILANSSAFPESIQPQASSSSASSGYLPTAEVAFAPTHVTAEVTVLSHSATAPPLATVLSNTPAAPPLPTAALPAAAAVALREETISVMVPTNYPRSGDTVTVVSPITGQILNINIPPGSVPGTQFLIRISN